MLLKKHFYCPFFLVILFTMLSTFAQAQAPANDNCAGAITLNVTPLLGDCPTFLYSNVGGTDATGANNSPNPTCFNGLKGFKDVWFKFTTPATGAQNFRVEITGVNAADSLKNPQAALYIGDCTVGLFEEYCQTQFAGRTGRTLRLEAGNMRANTTYYIQVANFQSTDAGGRFSICVKPMEPFYILKQEAQTSTSSVGILYDTGGPNGNYSDSENEAATSPTNRDNYTFNIRPTGAGCIEITIDSLGTETNYDTLSFYDGRTGELLDRVSGTTTQPLVFQVPTNWIRVQFRSDQSTNSRGFKMFWKASSICNAPKPTTCTASEIISTLPFQNRSSTCNDKINDITGSACPNDEYLEGKDHVFKFSSSGGQCIKLTVTNFLSSATVGFYGRPTGLNIGIFRGCPSAGGECIAQGKINATRDTVNISNANLELPGDYYIVVTRREACTPFNITIESVPCLNRLPNAGFCNKALSLNDCSTTTPSDIALDLSSQGDSSFVKTDPPSVNAGCIGGLGFIPTLDTPRYNFVFLYFKANASGKFSFNIASIVDDPNSDIDFNFYGPINTQADICTFAKNNRPVRSSFGIEGTSPSRATGMLDAYTNRLGQRVVVTDTCEVGTGDGVVKTLDVEKDKYYLLWLNDYEGTVGKGGVRLNFAGTANGVLNAGDPLSNFTVGRDTILYPGRSTTLTSTGGITYTWTPPTGLNNPAINAPIATPSKSTTYNVVIQGTCRVVPKSVRVGVFEVKKFPDATVCNGEEMVFEAGENYAPGTGASWVWTSPTNHLDELSCSNCNSPSFKARNRTGSIETHTFIVTLNTPAGRLADTFDIRVTPGQVANYQVITYTKTGRDTNVCIGSTFNLLRTGFDATANYVWSSVPASTITDKNPSVSPIISTKYYVTVTGGVGGCPAASTDSVIVNVFQPPVLTTIGDTTLCVNTLLKLGSTAVEEKTTYAWSPTTGLDNANSANPTLTVQPSATPISYTLTATNLGGCVTRNTIKVTGINLQMRIDAKDTINHCKGTPLTLKTVTTPANIAVRWSSDRDFSVKDSVVSTAANPTRNTNYYATVSQLGCTRRDTLRVLVDSLPFDTRILPKDTTVCAGTEVTFYSPTFEPYLFPDLRLKWTPMQTLLTSDTLYNLVITADTATLRYYREASNGVCVRKDSVNIIVNPIPMLTVIPRDTTICSADVKAITLRATSNIARTTDWKWKDPSGQEIPSGKGQQNVTIPSPMSGVYTVEAKVGDCPGSGSAKITIENSPSITFPTNDIFCFGNTSGLTLNSSPPQGIYQWTSTPAGFISSASNPSVTPSATTTYNVTVTSPNGCRRTLSKEIRVAIGTLTTSPDTTACTGNTITLTANGTSNISSSYAWGSGERTNSITKTIASTTEYSVTYNYGGNCTISKTIKVTALPGFTVRINPDTFSQVRLTDQGTVLNLTSVLSGNFTSPTYVWTDNGKDIGTAISATVKPLDALHVYKVAVKSTTGCNASAQVNVSVRFPGYQIANAFTPNGDNINSTFYIEFDPENKSGTFNPANPNPRFWKGNISVQSFQIFNRWGGVVFEENNVTTLNDKAYKGWDGKKGGRDVPSDVYIYIFKLKMPDDSIKNLSGELHLIR